MNQEEQLLGMLYEIRKTLQRMDGDLQRVKKAVLTEAEVEEQELELDREMKDLETHTQLSNEERYKEETLDEVEKELGK